MKNENRTALLRKIPLFSSLSDKDIQEISARMIDRQFRKNDIILQAEDTNSFMYIIWSGKVKVVRTTEEGKEVFFAMHQVGDFFGEMTLIDGKTTPASVIAIEPSMISTISKQVFRDIVSSRSEVGWSLLEILCSRLRHCYESIQLLNFNNATQRIKMLFLILSDEYGEKSDEGMTLNLKLTHQGISEMTGMTRETVTRVLDKLQKNKDITILKNKFIRLKPDFLSKDMYVST